MTARLLLARHGQTADNAGGRILGRRDPPLTPTGIAQAEALGSANREAGIAAIYASPLDRARRTAEIAGAILAVAPRVLDDLIESARGTWEGRPVAELAEEVPALVRAFVAGEPTFAFPGGESLAEQGLRTARALDVVAAGPSPALVVAHAGTIRAALALWGCPPPPEAALGHGEVAVTRDEHGRVSTHFLART